MLSPIEITAAVSSATIRLAAFTFLRWIPGHHFPPIIVAAFTVYTLCIVFFPEQFESKERLPDAFPAVVINGNEATSGSNKDEATLIGQSDIPAEPIFDREEQSFIKVLLLGLPDWGERYYSYLTISVNILLALFTLDLVFRGPLLHPSTDLRFSRVGYVDSSSARVLLREPDSTQYPVYVYLKATDRRGLATVDRIFYLDSVTDYTYPVTFTGLNPASAYQYSFSNHLSGSFITAPVPASPASDKLTFLTSSCIKANFPYSPFSNALAIRGFAHLSKILQSIPPRVSFMLFLGDFIYVDVPMRLSSSFGHYRSEYRRVYASPSWKLPGLSSLPWLHTLDDHEIANDWSAGNQSDPFPAASDPFIHYHVSVNPPTPHSAPSGSNTNTTYFQFTQGPASFFMLDTRRYRTNPETQSPPTNPLSSSGSPLRPSNPEKSHHTMLGAAQLSSLLIYLSTPEPLNIHWKIIASSVPFTKNWRFGTPDTWGGFPTERATVLAAMHAAEANLGVRVIVLSGDRHEFGAIRFPPPQSTNASTPLYDQTPSSGPHEFSVSPLSMFYLPFRTFRQVDNEDVAIKYIPDGNSKVGVVDLVNLVGVGEQKSLLKYSLRVDGKVAWEYTLVSPAVGFGGREGRKGGIWG